MIDGISVPNVEVGDRLGGGTFGQVYRGRHRTLDVDVAVKIVSAGAVGNIEGALKEARLMARLDHPNLLRILDAGQTHGALYLVLELMDGTCEGARPLNSQRALDLIRQLLTGVQALHDANILHRDIKPANCLVRHRDQRVKLADLGIAVEQSTRSSRVYEWAGTLPYMAPELFEDPPRFSQRSDLYAVGRTMHYLLLDRDPFPRETGPLLGWIREGPALNISESRPDLPQMLSRVIDRLCARSRGDRPTDASEAIAALTQSPIPLGRRAADETARLIGSWVLGSEIDGDGNFHQYVVTHLRSGAPGRLALLKERCPLAGTSDLIVTSAERASQLSHPNIADVVDWGMHAGRAYVVTRAQGVALNTLVESGGPIDEIEALAMARDLAEALVYLHGVGLVYQVVSPLFVLLANDGRTVELAWPMFCAPSGSSATVTRRIFLPIFAAPESLIRSSREGPPIMPSADVYGLGTTLFYLIAGTAAHSARRLPQEEEDSEMILLTEKLRGPAKLRDVVSDVSAPTAQLVADLTSPNPDARPATAAAVRDRIDRILRGLNPSRDRASST